MDSDPIPDPACWRQALKLLARRMHSRRELGTKLRQRGYATTTIAAVLAEAERLKLLDDAAFAAAYRTELERKGWGELRIRAALRRRGVETVQIAGIGDATAARRADEQQRLEHALARKLPAVAREPDPRQRREKLARFLLNRGFSPELVREALSRKIEALGDENSPDQ